MPLHRRTILIRLSLATLVGSALLVPYAHRQAPAPVAWLEPYREAATSLIQASTSNDFAWQRLAKLTDRYGHRLSGSENLDRAVAWAVATMIRDGLENVRAEPVMVPTGKTQGRFHTLSQRCGRTPALRISGSNDTPRGI